ncbi:hypothetical protein FXO37_17249 [Capsicum annuum]|nr:hypothetical protein FXO37_17249 [Capsicum annuum]
MPNNVENPQDGDARKSSDASSPPPTSLPSTWYSGLLQQASVYGLESSYAGGSNVDTSIVFRSVVPIFVAIGEILYLHQPWPTIKTWVSLGTIFAGSVLYVITDS